MTIDQTITTLPAAPDRSSPSTFSDKADAFLDALPDMVTEENTWAGEANTLAATVNQYKTDAESARDLAVAATNGYRWTDTGSTRAFAVDEQLIFEGAVYVCLTVTSAGESPTTHPAKWAKISTRAPSGSSHTGNSILTINDVDGTVIHNNTGAAGEIILTWTTPSAGQKAKFYVDVAQYFQIKAPSGVTIRCRDKITIDAGRVRSNVIGEWIEIWAISSTELIVSGIGGTGWLIETS